MDIYASLLRGSKTPNRFEVRKLMLETGTETAVDDATWLDTIVLVEDGELELVPASGPTRTFMAGDLIVLARIGVRSMRCAGPDTVRLTGVSRRHPPESGETASRNLAIGKGES